MLSNRAVIVEKKAKHIAKQAASKVWAETNCYEKYWAEYCAVFNRSFRTGNTIMINHNT